MAKTLKVTAELDISGPLSDGRYARALEEWQDNTAQALAGKGVDLLRAFPMNKTGRAHGDFENSLHTVRRSLGAVEIPGPAERGVTWAPWLEGTSKRNEGNSFKGYHLFRKTRQDLNRQAEDVGQRELEKVLPQIGGT